MTDPLPVPAPPASERPAWRLLLSAPVVVAALGYFVDIYDLILFSIVRVPSLTALGLTPERVTADGALIFNLQMIGMLIGGVIWGVLGDRRGRVSILFASIVMYSLANLANAGVGMSETVNGALSPVAQYAILRFIAGIGLAGELGVGITLVAESLPVRLRGLGTMLVASVGVAGATVAFWVADHAGWRTAYVIGGAMGLALLGLRIFAHESGMFAHLKPSGVRRGDFLSLFTAWSRLSRYLACIGIGLPTWFAVGIFVVLAKEMGQALGATGPISPGKATFWCYSGLIAGDLASGLLSQLLRSRRRALLAFLLATAVVSAAFLLAHGISPAGYYGLCFALGIAVGYWALFVTVGAEQFGTNLRATVATTVPNFVRGMAAPITWSFLGLGALAAHLGLADGSGRLVAAAVVGALCLGLALWSLWSMRETFSADLDYSE